MGKISFDIILTLKNNILGGLVNIKKQFDAIDKAGEQASATTTRFGNICSRLKMPDLNAFLGVFGRKRRRFVLQPKKRFPAPGAEPSRTPDSDPPPPKTRLLAGRAQNRMTSRKYKNLKISFHRLSYIR